MKRALGTTDVAAAGWGRTWKGLREGDQRELYLGLGLAAIAYLQRTSPRKELLFRKTVPEGSAIVIHHRGGKDPKIKVTRGK